MQDPQRTDPSWPMTFVTPDQLETAMAHPDYSGCQRLRDRTYGIDGYLVTFGKPAMQRAAQLLDERRQRYETAKGGEQA